MKKKYLAIILSCVLMAPCFLSSCGRLADEIVEEEEDEDEDDEEDEEEEEIIYVDVIDEDDLEDQIDVIVKNRSDWIVTSDISAAVDHFEYCVTDLDHNGRAEVISIIRFEYEGLTEVHIYEVDEKGKGLKEARWKYKGLEVSSDTCPDFSGDSYVSTFYDKKENTTHFLMDNSFDNGNGEYGVTYCDLSYSDGKMVCWNYGAFIYGDEKEYLLDDGTEIDNSEDFVDYLLDYPKRRNEKEANFGLYIDYPQNDLNEFDDDTLDEILTASYLVYSGEMKPSVYDETYNVFEQPQASDELQYEDLIGRWILYSSDDGYNVEYYDESSDYFSLVFYEDYGALFTVYFDGEVSIEKSLSVDLSGYYPIMEIYDPEHEYLDESIDHIQILVMGLSDDGEDLNVYYLMYDEDGYIDDGYDLVFRKDKYYTPSDEESFGRYVGDWGLYSSELEGDVTYYTEDGYRYVTLSVYDDNTVSMKEYENGRMYLEINADVEFDPVGPPYFRYFDEETLNNVVASETYTFDGFVDDEDTLQVSIDFYDKDDAWLGYTVLTFVRL